MASSTIHRRVSTRDSLREQPDDDKFSTVRRRLKFSISLDEDEDTSCWANTWKFCASLLLTSIFLGPFLYSSYQKYHQQPSSTISDTLQKDPEAYVAAAREFFLATADQLSCAKELNITYSQLFMDVKLKKSPALCRKSDTERCQCPNPTVPRMRNTTRRKRGNDAWRKAFKRNQEMASSAPEQLDVVFLGDSITEQWLGTSLGRPNKYAAQVPTLWSEFFGRSHALALGLSGDQCNNLLYRLMNGEMPSSLNPTAWWILIGTNDYKDDCNRETILAGQLGVLEEALFRKPEARFILQGILPRGKDNLLESTQWQDFQWINDRLACLAELPQLDFFNGTSLFLNGDGETVNQTLLYDFLHPSYEGHKLWGQAMVEQLKQLGIWTTNTAGS